MGDPVTITPEVTQIHFTPPPSTIEMEVAGGQGPAGSPALGGMIAQQVTQAEYDAIPEPRPANVLYIITP